MIYDLDHDLRRCGHFPMTLTTSTTVTLATPLFLEHISESDRKMYGKFGPFVGIELSHMF